MNMGSGYGRASASRECASSANEWTCPDEGHESIQPRFHRSIRPGSFAGCAGPLAAANPDGFAPTSNLLGLGDWTPSHRGIQHRWDSR